MSYSLTRYHRIGSPTDGATLTLDLGEQADGSFSHRGVHIPPGVAHGFAALTDAGYDGPVCVEVEDRAYEGSLDDRKRALRQSRKFLEQFVG